MNKNNEHIKHDGQDEVLQELWETKDYYSLSCNSDFKELVRQVKTDIKEIDTVNEDDDISADGRAASMSFLSA